ncbi:MAG: alanyl-tRNA editing protein [Rhodospirillales bacterium]|nr:alanyl-tRNA editing protein [Rhodospirillales bacterium]MCW8970947.1 alanyl-tRNA editing protein [Rhodospirillales bacterium]MCW9002777.1 alanyl-tRNA editing protein [Rhodospirillales bacterium]MCW9039359.1 alanyl-tRNA editing protein [Rhodospirillales bacterium]
MTEELFRDDSYARACPATVLEVGEDGVVLDRTVFYPTGGGQPGDVGVLRRADGSEVSIIDTRKDRDSGAHLHVPGEGAPALTPGEAVTAEIDWERRHRLMRMHTCLHLMCGIVEGAVTGGSIGEEKGRLDFDMPESPDKEALEATLNRLIAEDHPVTMSWISDAELAANPDLVRTMSVSPPTGSGSVRVIAVEGVDLQPCGGTHVRRTGEIGAIRIGKIEKKGRLNRRINIHFGE